MPASVFHAYTNNVPNGTAPSVVRPVDWNSSHLDKGWREVNAPHAGYDCDFTYVLVGTHDPNDAWVSFRNMETKSVLMSRNINVTTDMIATLTKR